jgi:competence protein ComEC
MLAGLGSSLAAFLWRRRSWPLMIPVSKVAALVGFLTAFIYAWLAGFQIPAQRTMYMVGVVAFALWSGRNPRSFDIWWWALAFVLLLDPMAPYTPGFWLSFGAVAAILFAMKDSDGLLGVPTGKELELGWKLRIMQGCKEACRVQTVVTVALLPITLYWFYQVSVVSPLANAIAIPLVSYVVTPLAISGALLPEMLGRWLLLGAHITMEGLAVLLQWFAAWEWSVVWSHQPYWLILVISCMGIVIAIRPGPISNTWTSRVFGILISFSVFLKPIFFDRLMPGDFRVTALDIGQGTAVLIQTANRSLLYDTGPTYGKKDDAGKRVVLPFLRGSGINRIDRMIISHSDSDHVGGAFSLLDAIQVESMIGSLPSNNTLLHNLRSKKVPSLPCRYGQTWVWDDVEFYVWHPHETTLFQSAYSLKPNEMSCVLEVRNSSASFWLTGDIEKQGESAIVSRLSSEVLQSIAEKNLVFMAPHHGSKTSSSVELLKGLNPDIAFAQNAYKNRYGHPHSSVVTRYQDMKIPLFQTALTGTQIWIAYKQFKPQTSLIFWRTLDNRLWHRPIPSSIQ